MKKLNLNILLVSSLLALSACSTTGDGRLNANDKQEVINAAKKQTEAAKTAAEAAAAKVQEAQKAVEAATAKAEAMKREAEAAKTAAETAKAGAEAMKREAEKAKTAAETAKREAEVMKREAEAAKRVAEQASSNLADAAAKAEAAKTAAETATEKAKEAKRLAEEAKREAAKADTATDKAEAAQKAADEAKEDAKAAKMQAELVKQLVAAQANANSGTKPSTGTDNQAGTKPSEGTGSQAGTKPSEGAGSQAGTKPSEGAGSQAGTKPSEGAGSQAGTKPSEGAGSQAGTKPSEGAGSQAGTKPSEGTPTTPGVANGGGTTGTPGAPPKTREMKLVEELNKTFAEPAEGKELKGGVFSVTREDTGVAATPVVTNDIKAIVIGDKRIRLLQKPGAPHELRLWDDDLASGPKGGIGYVGRSKLGDAEGGEVRWGFYTEKDKSATTLFVHGKETALTEMPDVKFNYSGNVAVTYKQDGIYRTLPGSLFAAARGLKADAVVDFPNKRVDFSFKPEVDFDDPAKSLEFGATITGNTFAGDDKGVISKGGFFGKDAAMAAGVFFGKEGSAHEGWNGVFGLDKGNPVE